MVISKGQLLAWFKAPNDIKCQSYSLTGTEQRWDIEPPEALNRALLLKWKQLHSFTSRNSIKNVTNAQESLSVNAA